MKSNVAGGRGEALKFEDSRVVQYPWEKGGDGEMNTQQKLRGSPQTIMTNVKLIRQKKGRGV